MISESKTNKTETDIEQISHCHRGEKWWDEWNRWGRLRKVQTSSYQVSHRDVMYSMGNIVNNTVTTLYGDRW